MKASQRSATGSTRPMASRSTSCHLMHRPPSAALTPTLTLLSGNLPASHSAWQVGLGAVNLPYVPKTKAGHPGAYTRLNTHCPQTPSNRPSALSSLTFLLPSFFLHLHAFPRRSTPLNTAAADTPRRSLNGFPVKARHVWAPVPEIRG